MADGLWQVGLWQQGRAGGLAMIGIGHPREIARPTHGYAETREAAMATDGPTPSVMRVSLR
jgi:hypothetical protein